MSISLHPDTPEGRTLAASPVAGRGAGGGPVGHKDPQPAVHQIRRAVRRGGRRRAAVQRNFRGLLLLSRAQGGPDPDSARAGRGRGGQDRPVHQGNRKPARLDHPVALVGGSLENRRFDALRLLRQVPAITELAQVDSTGKERLRVSRLAMDVVNSGVDLSKEPKFLVRWRSSRSPPRSKVYYGPVYFRRESEPYMTLSLAGTRKDAGVSIAEVNLKLIWDVVSQIKVGERGHAYVVGAQGRLIAHPDISLVLRNTDMSKLAQVQAARAGAMDGAPDALQGALEHPGPGGADGFRADRAARLDHVRRASGQGSLCLAVRGAAAAGTRAARPRLIFAVLAGMFLARRMVGPIQALARRRRAHRQRRFRPAHLDQDRRRTGRPRQPVQRHGRAAAGILCRPGKQGRIADG